MSSHKTTNSQMEPYVDDGDLFHMGAQTEWFPAEHFMGIDNWDESLKPSASYYIKQVEEWIASKEEHLQENKSRNVENEEQENDGNNKSVIITKPTPNNDVDESIDSNPYLVGGAKSFPCDQCGNNLSSKYSLTSHLRVDSREKPFSCSQCGKSFAQKWNLTRHNRILWERSLTHVDNVERPLLIKVN